ncbi:MAG: aspartate aminotransferase family protein [Spirochaetes bacterium]|nr:aspartate aminotransferase family protein [Spirochaetota bacterium]
MNIEGIDKEGIIELAVRHVCPGRVATFRQLGTVPVMGRRQGNYFWDLDGRRLFDVHINGGTYNLGHRNPELVETLKEALDHYDMGNHHFVSPVRTRLAEALIAATGKQMQFCVFTPCGGEAIEVAIRSCRRATGRRKIVSFVGSYHGHGGLGLRAGDDVQARSFLSEAPAEEFIHVPFNDTEAMEAALRGDEVAAVLCEIIPATSGFPMPSPGFYPALWKLCRDHGALLVADEVQTGLMRTGEMWASRGYGIEPDVLVTGKGLSGGLYPVAAAILSKDAGAWLPEDGWGHSSTFGGAELGCIVALKVLEIIGRPGVAENVRETSRHLAGGLREIQSRHPFLLEIRQNGLVIGLKFDNPLGGALMTACAFETGLWAFPAGFDRSVLQFKPNLLVDRPAADEALSLLEKSMELCETRFLGGRHAES